MIPCRFFAHGSCRAGTSCKFMHGEDTGAKNQFRSSALSHPAIERLSVNADTNYQNLQLGQQNEYALASDSRAGVPCRFLSQPGGCQRGSCPFLHAGDSHHLEDKSTEDEDEKHDGDHTRGLSGATAYFSETGHIVKVTLPTDYSLACITGFRPGTSPKAIVDILRKLGFNSDINGIRIPAPVASSNMKAIVKVENPLFAQMLSARLKNQGSRLRAVPVAMDARQLNCRKVYISWHKATRSVWLNFGSGEIANRVAQKFNEGRYQCLGQPIRSSSGRKAQSRGTNPVAWTIVLSDVPGAANSQDVKRAIVVPYDRPRHIEMGDTSYQASDRDVSVNIRSRLEEHGPLESFYLAPPCERKRVKATAWFQDEADARSARSLNNATLDILGNGKLTVTLIQSAKVKVPTKVYFASKTRIDEESKIWKELHLVLFTYQDASQRFTTLKVEGSDKKDVANAHKDLHAILRGDVLVDSGKVIWHSALGSNGSAYNMLKEIEKELHAVLIRDKLKRQVQFHGPPEKFQRAVSALIEILKKQCSVSYDIELSPDRFSWVLHGGFKSIEQTLGKNVAVLNVVCRKITINGTQQQYNTALAMMDEERGVEILSASNGQFESKADCPICLCEAENPIQTSCKHIYCLECFEETCKSAASAAKDIFQIRCEANEGNCSTVFTLHEIKDYLSSEVFEGILASSFDEYIRRHPEAFHYCPTPDCGFVYRCTTASGSKLPAYICPNCFEPFCTSCHHRHGDYTCAEYREIASGGYEALERLKRELNIKDCPTCSTPIEKIEGCNHVTCGGCRAHICWVCMSVFKTSGPCYDHMNKEHGGNGLDLERFIRW